MEIFRISEKEQGRRLDVYMTEKKHWPRFFFMKALKNRKLKVNGKKEEPSYRLAAGDVITSYVQEKKKESPVSVIYEDEQVLLLHKPAGLLCMDITGKEKDTLLDRAGEYLLAKGEGKPYPVHRIDRGTSGLFLLGKNEEAGHVLEKLFQERKIHKTYLCIVLGRGLPPQGRLTHQIFKDAKQNRVFLSDTPVKGSRTAVLDYEKLAERDGLALVRCRLITGRTHQIRGQFAYIGHPLLGDNKYGKKEINRVYGEKQQLLASRQMAFDEDVAGILHNLAGQTFTDPEVPFLKEYFPGVQA